LRLVGTALRIPDDGVVLPQTARHPFSPQCDGIGLIDWWHNDVLGLMYEGYSQDQRSLRNRPTFCGLRRNRSLSPALSVQVISTGRVNLLFKLADESCFADTEKTVS
jgi:hypothetical protein